jgi:hypothetical protein
MAARRSGTIWIDDAGNQALITIGGGNRQFNITPDDNTDLAHEGTTVTVLALRVTGSGNVAFIAGGDTLAVTWIGCVAGEIIPMSAKRVLSTGTTATGLVGLY